MIQAAAILLAGAATLGPLAGRTVMLDPGHGGKDGGTRANGIVEKDLNLTFALELESVLRERGARVILTRRGDHDLVGDGPTHGNRQRENLRRRVALARRLMPDVYLSLHGNFYGTPQAHGAQVFVDRDATGPSVALGQCLMDALRRASPTPRRLNRGIAHYLLRNLPVPTATVEIGFLSNPREARALSDPGYRRVLAGAVADGLACYFRACPSARGRAGGSPSASAGGPGPWGCPAGPPPPRPG